jgi:hypothetical protein
MILGKLNEIGADFERRPAVHLFQIEAERLGDQPFDLSGPLNDVDQRENTKSRLITRGSSA